MATVYASLRKERSPSTARLAAERDILTLLRHLTNKPLTVNDLRRELLWCYTEFQILESILSLLEKGMIETVYPAGSRIGFKPTDHGE